MVLQNKNKNSLEALFNLGYIYSKEEEFIKSEEYFKKVIELNPKHIDNFDVVDNESKILNDPYRMGHRTLKNNDYYTCAVAFVSMDLIKRKSKCNVLRR